MSEVYHEYRKILVPLDGSNQSKAAFKKAIAVAKRNHAALTLLNVIDIRAYQGVVADDPVLTQEATKRTNKMLAEYARQAFAEGVQQVDTRIEYGSPKSIISYEVPESEHTDLIMIGATGLNAIERLVIGSVSEYVIRHAPCDVMVVRTNLENQPLQLSDD